VASVEQRFADLAPTGKTGAFALGPAHWKLLGDISRLDEPDKYLQQFVVRYLGTRSGMSLEMLRANSQTLARVRRELAGLGLGEVTAATKRVATDVLALAVQTSPSPLSCMDLLQRAFEGHEALLRDVFAACCALCGKVRGVPDRLHTVALAALAYLCGNLDEDVSAASLALAGGDETAVKAHHGRLLLCCEILAAVDALRDGEIDEAAERREQCRPMLAAKGGQTLVDWCKSACDDLDAELALAPVQ